MYSHPSILHSLIPGEPTQAALHREEFYNSKQDKQESTDAKAEVDHRAESRASLLRAQVTARVGRYFA